MLGRLVCRLVVIQVERRQLGARRDDGVIEDRVAVLHGDLDDDIFG